MATPPPPALAQAELSRAARVLALRSRLEATGLFAGNYRSAFRGGGLEYEESRPYAPGDDVRSLDASATARTGVPYVKIFREERDRTPAARARRLRLDGLRHGGRGEGGDRGARARPARLGRRARGRSDRAARVRQPRARGGRRSGAAARRARA